MFVWTITDVVIAVVFGVAVLLGILRLIVVTWLSLRIRKALKKKGKK